MSKQPSCMTCKHLATVGEVYSYFICRWFETTLRRREGRPVRLISCTSTFDAYTSTPAPSQKEVTGPLTTVPSITIDLEDYEEEKEEKDDYEL